MEGSSLLVAGLEGSWEILSYKYKPPVSLRGEACLKVLQGVWSGNEGMDGAALGCGFLMLYELMQGSKDCEFCLVDDGSLSAELCDVQANSSALDGAEGE